MQSSPAESSTTSSPFATPAAVESDEQVARTFMGETLYEIAKRLRACYLAIIWQLLLVLIIPATAFCTHLLGGTPEASEAVGNVSGPLFMGIWIVAVLYASWSVYRLGQVVRLAWLTHWASTFLSLIPFLGLLWVLKIAEAGRTVLEQQKIPLSRLGADWNAIARRAAAMEASGYYEPSTDPRISQLYNLVFCDDMQLAAQLDPAIAKIGWPAFPGDSDSAETLLALVNDEQCDARLRLLAATKLRSLEQPLPGEQSLGLVFEAATDDGIYLMAFYADGGAVCVRQGSLLQVIPPGSSATSGGVRQIIREVAEVCESYFPSDFPRQPPPEEAEARITLLTTYGPRIAEGSWRQFYQHPSTKIVAEAAVRLGDLLFAADTPDAHEKGSEG